MGNDVEGSGYGLNLRHHPDISLEGFKKTMHSVSQNS
jgi:hypothetical protein